jgi:hypothetical protein
MSTLMKTKRLFVRVLVLRSRDTLPCRVYSDTHSTHFSHILLENSQYLVFIVYIMIYDTKNKKIPKEKADTAHSKWVHNVGHLPFSPTLHHSVMCWSIVWITILCIYNKIHITKKKAGVAHSKWMRNTGHCSRSEYMNMKPLTPGANALGMWSLWFIIAA